MQTPAYAAMVTSDWNECLAPSGPFDVLAYHYPEHALLLETVFRDYTGNRITLGTALERVGAVLPGGIETCRMDAFLERSFTTYRGVPELIAWCTENRILFMINTTAAIGFFQRALALGLLPPVTALAAHPWVRYPGAPSDPPHIFALYDTADKARHSEAAADLFDIPPERIVVIGDSGGDGPHFEWGAQVGARLVASMAKPSLTDFCRERSIRITRHIGHTYREGERRDRLSEAQFDFRELIPVIQDLIQLRR